MESSRGAGATLDRHAPRRIASRHTLVVLTALGACAVATALLVGVLGFTHLWYGFHDNADTTLYFHWATEISRGARPYVDFPFEYPPLALPWLALPGYTETLDRYRLAFHVEMFLVCAAAAVVTAVAAVRLWPQGRRPYVVALAFSAAVVANGAIVANRYDVVVALVVAAAVLLLVQGASIGSAMLVGLGFAIKVVPVVALPLALVLAKDRRTAAWALVGFVVAAAAPFVPFLVSAPDGLAEFARYHAERPLQVESPLAIPLYLAHLAGWAPVRIADGFGGQVVRGTDRLAHASVLLSGSALLVTYVVLWVRRLALRERPGLVPLAMLTCLLASIAFAKVLSPQYLVWLIPAAALVFPERPILGGGVLVVMLLTQIEFPALYSAFVSLKPGAVLLVALRNALLVTAFVYSVVLLWNAVPASGAPTAARRGAMDDAAAPLDGVMSSPRRAAIGASVAPSGPTGMAAVMAAAHPALFAGASVVLGFALLVSNGLLHPIALAGVTLATVMALAALAVGRDEAAARPSHAGERWAVATLCAGLVASFVVDALHLPGMYVNPAGLRWFRPVLAALAVLTTTYAWASPRWLGRARDGLVLAGAGTLGAIVIRASPVPAIDVWYYLQMGASALVHGVSPYAILYPNIYGPGTNLVASSYLTPDGRFILSNPYAPLPLLTVSPAAVWLSDPRWTLLAALLFSAWAIGRLGRGSLAARLGGAFLLVQPRTLFVIEQSWIEPLVLAAVLAAALAIESLRERVHASSGPAPSEVPRRAWLLVALASAAALAMKQYTPLLMVPLLTAVAPGCRLRSAALAAGGALLTMLPSALQDPGGLFRGVLRFQVEQPFRPDSLSWPAAFAIRPPTWLAFAAGGAVLALACRRSASLGRALAIGAVSWLVCVVLNKQAFCNYYWIVVGLFCGAVAAMSRVAPRAALPASVEIAA